MNSIRTIPRRNRRPKEGPTKSRTDRQSFAAKRLVRPAPLRGSHPGDAVRDEMQAGAAARSAAAATHKPGREGMQALHIKAPPYKKYLNEIFRLVLRALYNLCGNGQTRQNPKRKNFTSPNFIFNFDFKITHGSAFEW